MQRKLDVLLQMAKKLNKEKIAWAIGGSLLLYLEGIIDDFSDIDIMVSESHVKKLKDILLKMGTLQPPNPNANYKTKYFMEFVINNVDIDVMAGLTIVKDNKDNYFPFDKNNISSFKLIKEEKIPLQKLSDWKLYYNLMGRIEKAEMIMI